PPRRRTGAGYASADPVDGLHRVPSGAPRGRTRACRRPQAAPSRPVLAILPGRAGGTPHGLEPVDLLGLLLGGGEAERLPGLARQLERDQLPRRHRLLAAVDHRVPEDLLERLGVL